MFSFRYLLLAAAMVAAMPLASSRSQPLSAMMNKTVCAIEVSIDEDTNRIPQRIKIIKCAKQTDQWCVKNNIHKRDCCHHTHNRHVMECVEMTDTVMVYFKDKKESVPYDVSVGCTCIIGQSTVAPGLPPPT